MNQATVSTLLTDLLDSCVAAYTAVGGTPPARRFVSHGGQALWYGEQLTVTWTALRPVSPFPLEQQRAPRTNVVPSAEFQVEVVRACWPQPNAQQTGAALPDPGAIQTAALALSVDAATLFWYLSTLAVRGGEDGEPVMFPHLPTIKLAEDIRVGAIVPSGPQGQLAGVRFPVQVALVIP